MRSPTSVCSRAWGTCRSNILRQYGRRHLSHSDNALSQQRCNTSCHRPPQHLTYCPPARAAQALITISHISENVPPVNTVKSTCEYSPFRASAPTSPSPPSAFAHTASASTRARNACASQLRRPPVASVRNSYRTPGWSRFSAAPPRLRCPGRLLNWGMPLFTTYPFSIHMEGSPHNSGYYIGHIGRNPDDTVIFSNSCKGFAADDGGPCERCEDIWKNVDRVRSSKACMKESYDALESALARTEADFKKTTLQVRLNLLYIDPGISG